MGGGHRITSTHSLLQNWIGQHVILVKKQSPNLSGLFLAHVQTIMDVLGDSP